MTALFLGAGRAAADWTPSGVPLCEIGVCSANASWICPDGTGGAYVAWADERSGQFDVYVQRVSTTGDIAAGWPPSGYPVCTNGMPQFLNSIVPDGSGGVVLTWTDYRHADTDPSNYDIYAQRVLADATLPSGWEPDGTPVTTTPGPQRLPIVAPDGTGGAYFTWQDEASFDIYVQRLAANGDVSAGWPSNGLAVCTDPAHQGASHLTTDGSGGVIVAWVDLRDAPRAVYASRVLANGSIASGWPANGTRIVLGCVTRELIADGSGGAYLGCATLGDFIDDDYYVQRFTGAGTIAAGWPENGVPVCLAPDERQALRMVPDGSGGVLMAWDDYRDVLDDDVFIQRIRSDGTLFPGWQVDGMRLTNNQLFDFGPDLAPDGVGGAYLCWTRYDSYDREIAHHVSPLGQPFPSWPANGREMAGVGSWGFGHITEDGVGGAIMAWNYGDGTLHAQRLTPDGPVATQLSLASAEASPDLVRIIWYTSDGAGFSARVERRAEVGEWQTLATISADGSGRLVYEDHQVSPGRYAYRLAYRDGGSPAATQETWVEVPRLALALEGARPNPAMGALFVSFALPSADQAHLELFDLAGRRLAAREVGSLGAGQHRVELAPGTRLPAGVYSIALTTASERIVRRAILMR